MKFLCFLRVASLATLAMFLVGCVTTPDTTTPIATQIAQLRSDFRKVEGNSTAVKQETEELSVKVNEVSQETIQISKTVQQTQYSIQRRLEKLELDFQRKINLLNNKLVNSKSKDLEGVNKTLGKVIDTVDRDNKKLRAAISSDFISLQSDFKKLQAQLNSSLAKTDKLENQVANLLAAKAIAAKAPKPTAPKKTTTPASRITRTGIPSSADIDYENVYQHTVVSGESLWKIARLYNVLVLDIVNINEDVDNTTTLSIGQTIYVPSRKSKR